MSARSLGLSILLAAAVSAGCAAAAAQAPEDPQPSGAYKVVMLEDPALPGSTIYRPERPDRLAVVVWGNGGCLNAGNIYSILLTELASHGYLVVSVGPIVRDFDRPPPGLNLSDSRPEQMLKAIDWAVAENARPGGPLAGKVDVAAVAAMGTSCGGQQAVWAALNDARIRTVILGNSGLSDRPGRSGLQAADLDRLKVPALYLVGGEEDTAFEAVQANFARLSAIPVVKASLPVGHFETWHQENGGAFGQAALAWLDWSLKGSLDGARLFVEPDCGLCREPGWTIERKNIP